MRLHQWAKEEEKSAFIDLKEGTQENFISDINKGKLKTFTDEKGGTNLIVCRIFPLSFIEKESRFTKESGFLAFASLSIGICAERHLVVTRMS